MRGKRGAPDGTEQARVRTKSGSSSAAAGKFQDGSRTAAGPCSSAFWGRRGSLSGTEQGIIRTASLPIPFSSPKGTTHSPQHPAYLSRLLWPLPVSAQYCVASPLSYPIPLKSSPLTPSLPHKIPPPVLPLWHLLAGAQYCVASDARGEGGHPVRLQDQARRDPLPPLCTRSRHLPLR